MEKVVEVRALPDLKLFVRLAGGRCGIFDVRPYLRSAFFQRLADTDYFARVGLVFRGIGWPEGQDFGPDTLAADLQDLNDAGAGETARQAA